MAQSGASSSRSGDRKLISVCIPTYNRSEKIGYAIESVLGQEFTNYELVIVDNASNDGTLEKLNIYKDPKIKIHANNNTVGMYENHNICLEKCTSEWALFLHSDDELAPNSLASMAEILVSIKENDRLGLIVGKQNHLMDTLRHGQQLDFPAAFLFFLKRGGVTPSGTLFRKSAMQKIGGFSKNPDNLLAEDWALRLTSRGYGVACCDFDMTPGREDSTFPKMMADGKTHIGGKYTFQSLFDGTCDDELMKVIINDLPNWKDCEIAVVLRKLAQAELFKHLTHLETVLGERLSSVKKHPDYRHVSLLRLLGPIYWPLLLLYKKSIHRRHNR